VPSGHLGPNRNAEGSVVNGGEVAQKAMQIDNGFLRGDAKRGGNEGTFTEHIAFRQPVDLSFAGSCASPRTCACEYPHFGRQYQFAVHRMSLLLAFDHARSIPLGTLPAFVTGLVHQELLLRNEYLIA
jgi:hypothetical protein